MARRESDKDLYSRYEDSLDNTEIGEAWQYKVRVQKAEEESKNPYWEDVNLFLENAVVKPIERELAKKIIEEYEWLGCLPAIVKYQYGIFFDDLCGGVVTFSTEYAENLGVWDKYGFTGKLLLLSRGVCLHWTPKNTNSKLIMEAIKQLPKQYEVITATVDHFAGEVGTIYQACNFHYVGAMRESSGKLKYRMGCLINGKLYGSRSLRSKYGTQKKEEILKLFPDAKFIKQKNKDRYFLFRGSKKTKKEHYIAIEKLIKPYIKRTNIE